MARIFSVIAGWMSRPSRAMPAGSTAGANTGTEPGSGTAPTVLTARPLDPLDRALLRLHLQTHAAARASAKPAGDKPDR